MNKRLVFHLYLKREGFPFEGVEYKDSELKKISNIYNLHFYCLSKFCHIFDKLVFILSVDNLLNDLDLIREAEKRLLEMHHKGSISFEIKENNEFREADSFKKHVVDKLSENELFFFGHTKGITNVKDFDIEVIEKWIVGMYYFNLGNKPYKEVIDNLVNRKGISFGAFPMIDKHNKTNKYNWFYIGTFFWVNSGKLFNYIKQNNIDTPLLSDRFYAEEFLGDIYDFGPFSPSYRNTYLVNARDFYNYTLEYIKYLFTEEELIEFNEFFEEATKNNAK